MGIQGLLPVLKSITKTRHISEYSGKAVAIDGFSWLHKGAYCCSREIVQGVYTDRFVRYCMSRIEMIRHHGVRPIVVFDGGRLPSKSDEEDTRRRSRQENKVKALAHLAAGNVSAAEECFQRAVNVTSTMAKQFMEALKEAGVDFVVAPYEADAQMAYLALQGDVHAVITEDSDMLVYGCPRVLYKLDKYGNGEEILLEDLALNQGVSFVGFSHEMFAMTCIMAGCDFLPSLPNIGLKKAHQLMKKFRDAVKVCKNLRFKGTTVPRDYEERLQRALWVFRHQRVYCSRAKAIVHVQPLPQGGIGAADVHVMSAVPAGEDATTLDFLGPMMDSDLAQGIATGVINAATQQPFDLAAIYEGCARLPMGVAQALGRTEVVPRYGSQSQSQQQGSGRTSLSELAHGGRTTQQARPPAGGASRGGRGGAAPEQGMASIRSFFPATGPAAAAFVPPRAKVHGVAEPPGPPAAKSQFSKLAFGAFGMSRHVPGGALAGGATDAPTGYADSLRPGSGSDAELDLDRQLPASSLSDAGPSRDSGAAVAQGVRPSGRPRTALDALDLDLGFVLTDSSQGGRDSGRPLSAISALSSGLSGGPLSQSWLPRLPAGDHDADQEEGASMGAPGRNAPAHGWLFADLEPALPARPFQRLMGSSPRRGSAPPSVSLSPGDGAAPQLKRQRAPEQLNCEGGSSPEILCVEERGERGAGAAGAARLPGSKLHSKRRSLGSELKLSAFFGASSAAQAAPQQQQQQQQSSKVGDTAAALRHTLTRMKHSLAPLGGAGPSCSQGEPPAGLQPAAPVTLGRRQGLSRPRGPFEMFAAGGRKPAPSAGFGEEAGGRAAADGDGAGPSAGSAAEHGSSEFHGIGHVPRFGQVASAALDQMQGSLGLRHAASPKGAGGQERGASPAAKRHGGGRVHEAVRKPFKPPRAAQPGLLNAFAFSRKPA
ncbi:hypothetical protein FOA52_004908 [Chlamydomonas sp. UWO 241]|nr:hypothetical protein FOA52_004908 [Chlamydomonas sp. UWO 241]